MSRVDNLARFGKNNALEAEALDIVRHALSYDGRLTMEKSFEGTRADFCVHMGDPSRALGVQLKTTRSARQLSKSSFQYRFSDTNGYSGLVLLCVALDSRVQFWLMPGSAVTATSVGIPTITTTQQRYSQYHTFELDLADDFIRILQSPGADYQLASTAEFAVPTSQKGQREFYAFQHLKEKLPLLFTAARIEGSAYDCVVDDAKWQLKSATYLSSTDRFIVTVQKIAGRIAGSKKRKHSQYAEDDFDWLCIQMPASYDSAYLIPMSVLLDRGLAGRLTCSTATVHIYPHRSAHPKTRWIDAFKINLSTPETAIADYKAVQRLYHHGKKARVDL